MIQEKVLPIPRTRMIKVPASPKRVKAERQERPRERRRLIKREKAAVSNSRVEMKRGTLAAKVNRVANQVMNRAAHPRTAQVANRATKVSLPREVHPNQKADQKVETAAKATLAKRASQVVNQVKAEARERPIAKVVPVRVSRAVPTAPNSHHLATQVKLLRAAAMKVPDPAVIRSPKKRISNTPKLQPTWC